MNETESNSDSSVADLPRFIDQRYEDYDDEAHDVWRVLYERRMATLHTTGSSVFLHGIANIGLDANRVPDLRDVNRLLASRTGWAVVGVGGFIPARQFFRSLAERRFPTTLRVSG